MARLLLCVLALCAAGAYADPVNMIGKMDLKTLQERQQELMDLFYHIHEPNHNKKCQDIASTWSIEDNVSFYSNVTAAKTYVNMLKHKWYLPRAVPFDMYEPAHAFEVQTFFYLLYSAKDYQTFYKTAVYLRDIVNEGLYVYGLSVVILYRYDTQGIAIPPIYEIFPSYFNNGEIMTTAQRINTHGFDYVEKYFSTYKWDHNVVIRWNATTWPYFEKNFAMAYYTNDYGLNAFYYYYSLLYPYWLGSETVPGLLKDRRGEQWWFLHKQLLCRYYMERLSNGYGEIPELTEFVKDGYFPGLLYHNGIPFPVRPNNFHLDQPEFAEQFKKVKEYEHRVWEAIDRGYIVNQHGEHINILTPESIDVLGRLIEANADSPNAHFYKDFLKLWKSILGNSIQPGHQYWNHFTPLVLPSALELPQTALRDSAFYVLWKHVMKLFFYWQKQMPMYKPDELDFPSVKIEKLEVDKLVTYFEQTYLNVTNHLHMNAHEVEKFSDDISVVVQHPRLNHKPYSVRLHVHSDVAKTAVVKFFLAPKYDSKGFEIPLHTNTENFFLLDEFTYDLSAGENVITRQSSANPFTCHDWSSAFDLYEKVVNKQWVPDSDEAIDRYPHRLMLPKGRVGGMPFVFFAYIYEYRAPKVPFGSSFDPKYTLGLGSGARFLTDDPLGFPMNRPMYYWQVNDLKNMWFQDVLIYHKHTPEIDVPHTD